MPCNPNSTEIVSIRPGESRIACTKDGFIAPEGADDERKKQPIVTCLANDGDSRKKPELKIPLIESGCTMKTRSNDCPYNYHCENFKCKPTPCMTLGHSNGDIRLDLSDSTESRDDDREAKLLGQVGDRGTFVCKTGFVFISPNDQSRSRAEAVECKVEDSASKFGVWVHSGESKTVVDCVPGCINNADCSAEGRSCRYCSKNYVCEDRQCSADRHFENDANAIKVLRGDSAKIGSGAFKSCLSGFVMKKKEGSVVKKLSLICGEEEQQSEVCQVSWLTSSGSPAIARCEPGCVPLHNGSLFSKDCDKNEFCVEHQCVEKFCRTPEVENAAFVPTDKPSGDDQYEIGSTAMIKCDVGYVANY